MELTYHREGDYANGATMKQIRDWLNENGVKNKRGLPSNYNSVQHLLNNRRYLGEFRYRDVVIPGGIPAIVTEELFERVQERMEKNRKAPARHKAEDDYLLTTKLFCGYCGAYLCGEAGTSHKGKVYHYYKCVSVKKHRGCHKKPVSKRFSVSRLYSSTYPVPSQYSALIRSARRPQNKKMDVSSSLPPLSPVFSRNTRLGLQHGPGSFVNPSDHPRRDFNSRGFFRICRVPRVRHVIRVIRVIRVRIGQRPGDSLTSPGLCTSGH